MLFMKVGQYLCLDIQEKASRLILMSLILFSETHSVWESLLITHSQVHDCNMILGWLQAICVQRLTSFIVENSMNIRWDLVLK